MRFKIAKIVALAGNLIMIIGMFIAMNKINSGTNSFQDVIRSFNIMTVGMSVGCIAYLFAGLLTALRMTWNAAKWGWFLIPYFPIDLMVAVIVFGIVIGVFMFLPIIPILVESKESM